MKNAKVYKVIIVLLVVLNLATLAFMWYNRPGRELNGDSRQPSNFLIRELGLSTEQQEEYQKLRQEHRAKLSELSARDRILHRRFFDLLLLESADSISIGAMAAAIAANRQEMELVTYKHFESVKHILNAMQQQKFDKIFQDVIRMVLPQPPPPPSPPPPPAGLMPPPPPPPPAPGK